MKSTNDTEEIKEYVVKDFREAISVVLESDELELDGKLVTEEQKGLIKIEINKLLDNMKDGKVLSLEEYVK